MSVTNVLHHNKAADDRPRGPRGRSRRLEASISFWVETFIAKFDQCYVNDALSKTSVTYGPVRSPAIFNNYVSPEDTYT